MTQNTFDGERPVQAGEDEAASSTYGAPTSTDTGTAATNKGPDATPTEKALAMDEVLKDAENTKA
ncbi:MAG: hypothetical protein NVS4B8_20300 [Herpetosiphon sp.]